MCRAKNAVGICFCHIEWKSDALGIYFSHMKNDQMGERPRDARHIYANPVIPEVCPVLSLGIYLICFRSVNSNNLFPGSKQYDRFRKISTKLCNNELKDELENRGLETEDIGTHSMRKGSTTYCSSGSTSCPSGVAVNLRAGWAMGGVQDRYLRYDAAGYQYVGRTVCGLPILDPKFALLPPFFKESNPLIKEVKIECFGHLPLNMRPVSSFVMASLIFHQDFLFENLHKNHLLFSTSLFRNKTRLLLLKSMVACRLSLPDDLLKPTGIPPHVILLNQL
eukprot:NODE_701_length_5037_cov_0.452318.p2 type:complete len:279 gc:universal NODE_701_length_5037_cov_0.452318:418-1254(+)